MLSLVIHFVHGTCMRSWVAIGDFLISQANQTQPFGSFERWLPMTHTQQPNPKPLFRAPGWVTCSLARSIRQAMENLPHADTTRQLSNSSGATGWSKKLTERCWPAGTRWHSADCLTPELHENTNAANHISVAGALLSQAHDCQGDRIDCA